MTYARHRLPCGAAARRCSRSALCLAAQCVSASASSTEVKQDPRLVELAAVNCRLKTVLAFLKTKHTTQSLDGVIEASRSGIGDHSPAFVHVDGSTVVEGTRHLGSLLKLTEALEIKAEIGEADHAFDECVSLLERKVALLTELGSVR